MMNFNLKTVVVGVDYSDAGLIALRRAIELTEAGTLHFVHVIDVSPSGPMSGPASVPSLDAEAGALHRYVLEHLLQEPRGSAAASRGFVSHVSLGSPARELAQFASDLDADLIVVGTHGRTGLRRLMLGSVAEEVLRLAPCPVLVERSKAHALEGVPVIEPPCPRCLEERQASGQLWCAQHRERHGRRHTYHLRDESAAFPSDHPGLGSVS